MCFSSIIFNITRLIVGIVAPLLPQFCRLLKSKGKLKCISANGVSLSGMKLPVDQYLILGNLNRGRVER